MWRKQASPYGKSRGPYSAENDVVVDVVEINGDNNGNEDHNGKTVGYIDARSNESQWMASGSSFSRRFIVSIDPPAER